MSGVCGDSFRGFTNSLPKCFVNEMRIVVNQHLPQN